MSNEADARLTVWAVMAGASEPVAELFCLFTTEQAAREYADAHPDWDLKVESWPVWRTVEESQ